MAIWVPVETKIGLQPIADIDTTRNHPLGTRVRAYHSSYGFGEFIYLLGVASTAVGNAVVYNIDDHSTIRTVADSIGPVAFAMGANVASSYGWYQIYGKAIGSVLTGFLDNANCYLTSTAGNLDDTDVAGDYVSNCKGASAVAAGVAELEIWYPFVRDGLDN